MTTERTKITKLYETLEQSLKEIRALRKSTKKTQVIFLECLNTHEAVTKLMLDLLKLRKQSIGIYGR